MHSPIDSSSMTSSASWTSGRPPYYCGLRQISKRRWRISLECAIRVSCLWVLGSRRAIIFHVFVFLCFDVLFNDALVLSVVRAMRMVCWRYFEYFYTRFARSIEDELDSPLLRISKRMNNHSSLNLNHDSNLITKCFFMSCHPDWSLRDIQIHHQIMPEKISCGIISYQPFFHKPKTKYKHKKSSSCIRP